MCVERMSAGFIVGWQADDTYVQNKRDNVAGKQQRCLLHDTCSHTHNTVTIIHIQ